MYCMAALRGKAVTTTQRLLGVPGCTDAVSASTAFSVVVVD